MKPKEIGWVLSVDQASNAAGVVLWHNGELRAQTVLLSDKSTDSMSRRLQTIVAALGLFLERHLPDDDVISKIVFEGVKSRLVMVTVGAFLTCPRIQAKVHPVRDFVQSSSWKTWAHRRGATGPVKDIKGVKALREVGFPVDEYRIMSDDVSDAVLIYLTWKDRP